MAEILVVGGAGFVGSHTCKAIARAGERPSVFDSLIRGHRDAVKWGPLFVGDILSRPDLDQAIEKARPSTVVHFAALAYVGESVRDPAKYYENNVAGTIMLLEAMRAAKVNNIVFSSSCATYGIPDEIPIKEAARQEPINPYGRTKLVVERLLADYRLAYGLNYVALRYFNACGADPQGELGERHEPETHLIPRTLMAAAGRIDYLDIYGEDFPTPDGTCIRDYVHVTDLADAHLRAIRLLEEEPGGFAFNLGTGTGLSVREIVSAVESATGRKVPTRVTARQPGDPPILVADPTLARKKLGFAPVYSDIATIISTAWPFFR